MSKINIGINGAVMAAKKHGISRYTTQLLQNMGEIDTDPFEFTVLTGSEIKSGGTFSKNEINNLGTIERIKWDTFGFVRKAKSTNVDVIHSPDKGPLYKGGLTTIVTIHDLLPFLFPHDRSLPKRLYWQLSLRRQIKVSDAIITVSQSTKQDIIRLFDVDEDKIYVTYLGTDLSPPSEDEVEQIIHEYDIPKSMFNVLYVGNYNDRKNADQLVKACKTLDSEGLDLHLLLAGSNPPESQLSDLAGEFQNKITFLGYIPDENLEALYGAASLFVYPSTYEGFGLPVLEAMACGTPVITSNTSSLPEVVGDAGITVDPDTTVELSEAIDRVYSNEQLQVEMRTDGLHRAEKMTWKHTAQSTLDVYREIFDSESTVDIPKMENPVI